MNEATYRSVLAILAYLMPEEKRHWEESGKPRGHIYDDIARLEKWAEEVSKDYQ